MFEVKYSSPPVPMPVSVPVSHRRFVSVPVFVSHNRSVPVLVSKPVPVPVISPGAGCSKRSFAGATASRPKDCSSIAVPPIPIPENIDGESSRRKFEEEEKKFSASMSCSSCEKAAGMGVTRTTNKANATSVMERNKGEECIALDETRHKSPHSKRFFWKGAGRKMTSQKREGIIGVRTDPKKKKKCFLEAMLGFAGFLFFSVPAFFPL